MLHWLFIYLSKVLINGLVTMCCPCWGFAAAPWVGVDGMFANELKSRPQSIRGEKKITANFSKHDTKAEEGGLSL